MSTGDGVAVPSTPTRSGSSAVLSALGTPKSRHDKSPVSTPERPRKRIKLEVKAAPTEEIEELRQSVYNAKLSEISRHNNVYRENLLELFFLQNMGNIMDYFIWRKKPDMKVYQFLKSGQIDSDDEDWCSERSVLSEGLAISSSLFPFNQQTGSSWTPSMLSGQGSGDQRKASKIFGQSSSPLPKLLGISSSTAQSSLESQFSGDGESQNVSVTSCDSKLFTATVKTEPISTASTTASGISAILSAAVKSPSVSHLKVASSSSVPESITGTQEAIVERAKQEAAVMQRVSELRRDGMWSSRRLPKVQEPSRGKAHWDYLLEEMQWLAADFAQERKWKKAGARKIASMISKYHKERQMKEMKAEKDEANRTRKIASNLAKMMRDFWGNIEKVVEFKYQSRLEEKRKKAMDLHLSFIVDQTEKYSTWLTEGLATATITPDASSAGGSPTRSGTSDDRDFEPSECDEDDEETILVEEMEAENEESTKEELAELQKEMELPIEELLRSLPQEVLDKPASIPPSESGSEKEESPKAKKRPHDEEEFHSSAEDSDDDEETLEKEEEQEKEQGEMDTQQEINDLQDEGEMSLEELRKKYAGAYDSDFEMPEDSETPSEEETTSASDTSEEEEEEENVEAEKDDVGMEFLVKDLETSKSPAKKDNEPGSQLTDIAATAESIQPTGYTLETTKVRTAIPFLLKHTLREYQVVGLDWMATMYERRLNGILADEMGLGKTIQTIALLAHLACEKGIWGPHLIVVPTSVMLNWELEIKKWCPAFKILTYFGTQKERKAKRTGWTKTNAFHVCITSYKLVIQDHQAFRRKKWKYFILDEAQNIKNFKSQRWQTLLNFSSQRRLLLTGTPLQNNLMELWSLMHFLMPHVFQSHRDFKEWFSNPLTGMIEGSREYNENLIKRLHKVLRPFLLRRLKIDVEKQMPKKYEHIIRCHLSRRQRFLYDDFMSQSKTKETLASGHYMSVINILMQLRKVCNHPNLFDPRPILSPFQMEGIAFTTPSIVTKALDKDPLECIAPTEFHPSLADLELYLPAFVAHRIRLLHTPRKLIEEIDSQPEAPARPPPAEKPVKLLLRSTSPMPPVSGRASPFVPIQHRSNSPMSLKSTPSKSPAVPTTPVTTPSVETTQLHQLPGHTPQIKTSHPAISTPTSMVLSSVSSTSSTATSQPITVQIQNTPQGTRLMIPSGQLSQLPGYIQIVQTASGQQIIATSQPPPNHSSGTTVMNGPTSSPGFTTAGQSSRMTPTSIQLPVTTSVVSSKPVMKVSPLLNSTVTSPSIDSGVSSPLSPKSVIGTRSATRTLPCKAKEKSIFFNESVHEKRTRRRKDTLTYLARRNQHNTDIKPVYGLDLRDAVNVLHETKNPVQSQWQGLGYIHCHKIHNCSNPNHPNVFWKQTEALQSMVHTPEQYLKELQDILDRFTFVVPAVRSPRIVMRTFHPPPSVLQSEIYLQETLHREVSPKASCLHRIIANTSVQFPEVRLIQYDCGKLQTLDILLRQLKPGDHRALIFTQMTKMLDILEAFLNFHGHRYLRLDGTTKVEQRQALMDRFNADKRIFVFILSTRSGGLGVNLTGADTVIFYDSDWNPTMDAQAQDRCHRIGQTRDVHIYRLISEKTIEENILKKANQKRLLSDVTIEGGNFTTAFFKENTIKELFEEPSGLDAFVKDKNAADAKAAAAKKIPQIKESLPKSTQSSHDVSLVEESVQEVTRSRPPSRASSKAGSLDQEHLEQVLCTAEDEGDAQAAKIAKAEQSAELAEFDEDIPWDEKEAEQKQQRDKEMSRVEQELSMLEKELTPVERYAVSHMELQLAPVKHNELEKAEENVSLAKEEWELSRLKALKEEEERRAELEEDEMLFTYSREDAANQVYICDETGEQMPMWAPPTPPQDDHDVYTDASLYFLYEQTVMPETQLPPVYIKKEHKRARVDPAVVTRKNKARKEEQARVPKSLFDRPTSLLRRDTKLKLKQSFGLKPQATRPMLTRPLVDSGPEHPEWLIHEDWALLQAVQNLLELPLTLSTSSPGHIPNWDLVADIVNTTSRTYRSAKQCRSRYENVIVPREEGRILYDVNPRKQKKTKSIYKVYHTKNNRPMRTSQLYAQDNSQSLSTLYTLRFDCSKAIASKRTPTLRPTLTNPTLKNPKHAAVLGENGINYEQPLTPTDVAQIRAERIAKEKKEQQLAGQKSQATTSTTSSTVATVAVPQTATVVTQAISGQPQLTVVQGHQHLQAIATAAGTTIVPAVSLQKTTTVSAASVSLAKGLAAAAAASGGIVVNTAGGIPANAIGAINRKFGQTVVGSLSQNVVTTATFVTSALSQGVRVAPGRTYVQEINAAIAQARTTGAGALITTSTMSQAQLPRVAFTASTVAAAKGSVQPQITTTTSKLTQHHLRILQQKQQQFKQQQHRTNLSAIQTSQAAVVQAVQQRPTAVATVTTPLITSISGAAAARLQVPKQAITQQTKPRAMTEAEMAMLLRSHQKGGTQKIQTVSGTGQLTTAQILTAGQQVQSQAGTGSAAGVATLVKTVSTQGGATNLPSVTIPVSAVGLGITVPQKQGGRMTQMQVRQLMSHKGRTVTAAQLQTHKATLGQIQVPKAGGGVGTPLIIPQKHAGGASQQVIVQQIQQIVKQQSQNSQQQPQTVQQLISAATSNAATVLVTQAGQPVARLSVPTTTVQARTVAQQQHTLLSQPIAAASAASSTVTLQPASLVKNLQEVVVSPAKSGMTQQLKTLPVSTTTLRSIPGLSLVPGQTGTVNIQQIQQQAKLTHTPSPGVQQAVQQVVQQAQAQAQQRHLHSTNPTIPTATAPLATGAPPVSGGQTSNATQQQVVIQQGDPKSPYSTRLRTMKQ